MLVEQALDFWHQIFWCVAVRQELNDVALAVDEVLIEVPLNIVVRALLLQVLVECVGVVTLHIDLAENGEFNCES